MKRGTALAGLCLGILTTGLALNLSPAHAAQPVAGTFFPVDPVRVLDTRDGTGVADRHVGPLGASQVLELQITGANGVPASGVGAATLNVTVTDAPGPGWLSVYPCGEPRPTASNLNFVHGVDTANQVTAKVGYDGRVCFFASTHIQLIADLSGYWADNFASVPGFHYESVDPTRVLDSRDGTGMPNGAVRKLNAGEILPLQITGVAAVPENAAAASLNVTATNASDPSFLTVYPCGRPRPTVSNLNFAVGVDVANLVTSRIGDGGRVCLYSPVAVDVIADLAGYFRPWDGTNRPVFVPTSPTRILDTRDGTGIAAQHVGPLGIGRVVEVHVRGANGVGAEARSVLLNVTATREDGPGFLSVYPCGRTRPNASNLNFVRAIDRANAVKVRIGDDGRVCFFSNRHIEIVADQFGYFVPSVASA